MCFAVSDIFLCETKDNAVTALCFGYIVHFCRYCKIKIAISLANLANAAVEQQNCNRLKRRCSTFDWCKKVTFAKNADTALCLCTAAYRNNSQAHIRIRIRMFNSPSTCCYSLWEINLEKGVHHSLPGS